MQDRRRRFKIAALAFALLWPVLNVFPRSLEFSLLGDAIVALIYTIIAVSLVVLIGWVGQISLAQASFVGIGAFATGLVVRSWHIPFPLSMPIAAGVSGAVAAILGLVALRVRGLYLAVATLIFAWMTEYYLFSQPWLVGAGGSSSIPARSLGREGTLPFLDFTNRTTFFYVAVLAAGAVLLAAANIRDSKTGRAFFAVKGSELAAASLGIDIMRVKLTAFAMSGFIAGIAGNLLITHQLVATPISFDFKRSLFYLSIAVVGGLTSIGGALAAGILFGAIEEVFFRVEALSGFLEVVSALLLGAVLMFFPSGIAGIPDRVRPAFKWMAARKRRRRELGRAQAEAAAPAGVAVRKAKPARPLPLWVRALRPVRRVMRAGADRVRILLRKKPKPKVVRRSIDMSRLEYLEPAPSVEELAVVGSVAAGFSGRHDWRTMELVDYPLPPVREDRVPILEAEHIVVQFGGLRAVDDVSLEVREHEIVGLIGPNGAGKTTTFNAISGLNSPSSGTVKIFGEDATDYPVHVRAAMGVGRTFQLIQLFPQLTVFDNLLVANHVANPTGFFTHLMLTNRAVRAERIARQKVRQIVSLLGLEEVADRRIAGLPFGLLRQVEIARALVTQAPFLMLDEPASGLDNAETDELAQLLYFIRAELGVSILLIEHDVRMVTGVCDYMYVINRGMPLAEGTPAEIQRNPEVIAAYLGEAEKSDVEAAV